MVAKQFEGLFETVEVVWADQNGRRSTVAGDDNSLVFTVDAVNEFGEPVLHIPQRISRHGHDRASASEGGATRPEITDERLSAGHPGTGEVLEVKLPIG